MKQRRRRAREGCPVRRHDSPHGGRCLRRPVRQVDGSLPEREAVAAYRAPVRPPVGGALRSRDRGRLLEVVCAERSSHRRRSSCRPGVYRTEGLLCMDTGETVAVFVGLQRTRARIGRAEASTAEGLDHCTESVSDEAGFKLSVVAARSTEQGNPPPVRRTSHRHDARQEPPTRIPLNFPQSEKATYER